jgi:RNA-directed DNA polymerase
VRTESGTPQGGIISPTLCNIALNGVEEEIKSAYPNFRGISAGVHVIRYADDMVITGKNVEILQGCKENLSAFLKVRGLELNEKKTKITNVKEGFDFLGFNIRRMKHDPRLNNTTDQETVLVIKPSKKGIQKLMETVKGKIDKNRPLEGIIKDLNPVLRG